MNNTILHFLCGKMGAGKSTYSRKLAARDTTVLISEDEWLAKLYPDLISTFDDYLKYSALLKPVVFDHVVNLLQSGCNVVLDFPANTVKQREWFTDIARTMAQISSTRRSMIRDTSFARGMPGDSISKMGETVPRTRPP